MPLLSILVHVLGLVNVLIITYLLSVVELQEGQDQSIQRKKTIILDFQKLSLTLTYQQQQQQHQCCYFLQSFMYIKWQGFSLMRVLQPNHLGILTFKNANVSKVHLLLWLSLNEPSNWDHYVLSLYEKLMQIGMESSRPLLILIHETFTIGWTRPL